MAYRTSNGFTLIELIVVIVILGVLAVSAAPKFVNLKSDALAADLYALKGSLKSAISMAHGKMLIHGIRETGSNDTSKDCSNADGKNCILIGNTKIRYKNDYPDRAEVYKLIDSDIQIYSVYSSSTQCQSLQKLNEEARTCKSDYCFCGTAEVDNNFIKGLQNSKIKEYNFLHTNSVFWPKGTVLQKKLNNDGCFLMYIQAERAINQTGSTNNDLTEPLIVVKTDGC